MDDCGGTCPSDLAGTEQNKSQMSRRDFLTACLDLKNPKSAQLFLTWVHTQRKNTVL